ncbi:phospholipid phosphatase 5 [Diorhabda carinulata]|uniref:phospholipid phosphatase 5 n=1 Tax=Diorhabda carinulata TaxID=1163345 RepID=UPI0025A2C7DB|nr:phospholipid phosphatase 5 [Diorhabda carinulata]
MDKATTALHLIIESGFRVGFWIIFLWLDKLSPVVRHIDEDELWMYRYPSVDSYFPKRYLYMTMVCVPMIIYIGHWLLARKNRTTIPEIIQSVYGLTLAYCLNGIITCVLKLSVGRPRPNFYFRCFPEGYGTDIDNCDGEYHGQMDGRKSFPSAHASFIFTCMIYMILYINTRLDLKRPRFCKGIIISMMTTLFLFASVVAASRTADYHHHFSDVISGALIGSAIAYIVQGCYSSTDEILQENLLRIVKPDHE